MTHSQMLDEKRPYSPPTVTDFGTVCRSTAGGLNPIALDGRPPNFINENPPKAR